MAKGLAMGAADVVPGVSGGTMAFVLGIYEELLGAIRAAASPELVRLLATGRVRDAVRQVPFDFLVPLVLGIGLAIVSLARVLEEVLRAYPALLWSFFFGLVAASVITVPRRIDRWTPTVLAAVVAGAAGAFWIVGRVPASIPAGPLFVFASGFIAICAMILPGISGSFILVLLGKYQDILSAINERDLVTLAVFGSGAILGLASFARALAWLFRRYHDSMVALMTGFMAGSLRKIWPWKETIRTIVDRHGQEVPVEQVNVMPDGPNVMTLAALALAVAGFVVVMALDRVATSEAVSES